VQDFGFFAGSEKDPAPEPPEDAAFSCLWRLPQTLPLIMRQYSEQAPIWAEAADGFGYCTILDAATAAAVPAALEVLLAGSETQVVCLAPDVSDEDLKKLSDRHDEMIHRVMNLDGAATK